jgi:hypothetical protein
MIKGFKKNIQKHLFLAVFSFLVTSNAYSQPGCGCDELYDPLSQEYDDCIAACGEVIIPVNGNIWILIASGVGFAFYHFRKSKNKEEEEEA